MAKAAAVLGAGAVILLIGATPARAALPDHWAFAYLDNANPPTVPSSWVMDPARQAGTFQTACPGSTATASSIGPGGYRVTFPCIGSAGGIAHVTTVDALGGFCEVDAWGASARSTPGARSARTRSSR